jgi:hypothetical protein
VPVITILFAVVSFAFPPLFTRCVMRVPVKSPQFFMRWALGGFGGMVTSGIAAVFDGGWLYTAAYGASGLLGLILWWWSRRKRKRSLRALGAKARARLAAMVSKIPKPGPVLRPVPQGG